MFNGSWAWTWRAKTKFVGSLLNLQMSKAGLCFKILVSGPLRGELIWDPVKIWIIRAPAQGMLSTVYMGRTQFEGTGDWQLLFSAQSNLRGPGLLLGSAAIRRPVADPLTLRDTDFSRWAAEKWTMHLSFGVARESFNNMEEQSEIKGKDVKKGYLCIYISGQLDE